jgi:curved DNA-binding protein CbpA
VKDYYAILGISPTATESEIKKAFRRLAVRYHPDKNSSADAKPRFQEINEAYDVLGDAGKRSQYDARRASPFAEILTEPVRRHRDPAYRRKKTRTPRQKGPPASYILMRDSLPYVLWISRIGILITTLFFLDYFLPYHHVGDYIYEVHSYTADREDTYTVIRTRSGEEFRAKNFSRSEFDPDGQLVLSLTPVYGSVIWVANTSGSYRVWVAYMYTTLIFFPIILFINSLMGLVYRKRVEFCFNLNVTALILIIINLVLI